MKTALATLMALSILSPSLASADALSAAQAANICDVTAAEYLTNGQLKVTCREGTLNPAYSTTVMQNATPGLEGGTLSPMTVAGIALGIVLIAAVAGDSDGTAATTTTGTGY